MLRRVCSSFVKNTQRYVIWFYVFFSVHSHAFDCVVPLFRLKCLAVLLFIHSKNNDYTNEYQIFVSYRNDPQQNHHQSVFIGTSKLSLEFKLDQQHSTQFLFHLGLDYRHGGSPKSSSYTQSALESQQHKIILRLLVDSQNIFLSSQTSQQ